MHVSLSHVHLVPTRPEEGDRSPGTGIQTVVSRPVVAGNWGGKDTLVHTSMARFIMEGSQDRNSQSRNLEAGADAEAMEGHCLLAYSPWLARPAFL